MKKTTICLLIFLLIIVVLFLGVFIFETIDMLIDHQCYQLEPNDFYSSTICERYWNEKK